MKTKKDGKNILPRLTEAEEINVETQIQIVRDHLKRYGTITGKEAYDKYDIYRLSSIINRIRYAKPGKRAKIKTLMKWNKKRKARYAEYQLKTSS